MSMRFIFRLFTSIFILTLISPASYGETSAGKDYLSIQFYFQDYYGNWSDMDFYDSNNKSWSYYDRGCLGGYLELNAGLCWKHFFSDRAFFEMSLSTGVYSLEKSTIYSSSDDIITEYRIPPLEYIAQAGLGYCFYRKGNVSIFIEAEGSLSDLRAWRDNLTFKVEQERSPYFSWRGELGTIIDMKKGFFLEGMVGLFSNSNYYLASGHQVRIGIGKSF